MRRLPDVRGVVAGQHRDEQRYGTQRAAQLGVETRPPIWSSSASIQYKQAGSPAPVTLSGTALTSPSILMVGWTPPAQTSTQETRLQVSARIYSEASEASAPRDSA